MAAGPTLWTHLTGPHHTLGGLDHQPQRAQVLIDGIAHMAAG